tara:strand:+ start:2421 stop:2888 length:468 start_codon:yes stop_codon:yes gene_type:complete
MSKYIKKRNRPTCKCCIGPKIKQGNWIDDISFTNNINQTDTYFVNDYFINYCLECLGQGGYSGNVNHKTYCSYKGCYHETFVTRSYIKKYTIEGIEDLKCNYQLGFEISDATRLNHYYLSLSLKKDIEEQLKKHDEMLMRKTKMIIAKITGVEIM